MDRALVFDMDGVLIDSEPLWRRAEIACFAEVGVHLTEADCLETMGLRIDEAVAYWAERRPFSGASVETIAAEIIDRMQVLIREEGTPIEGVDACLDAAEAGGWRIGLASSSSMRLIETVLDAFGIAARFEVCHSAETEVHGKPAPDVYLSAARALAIAPQQAIAIEDSVNGVRSAQAAGMRCIAVPSSETAGDPRFQEATWRMDSLFAVAKALPELDAG